MKPNSFQHTRRSSICFFRLRINISEFTVPFFTKSILTCLMFVLKFCFTKSLKPGVRPLIETTLGRKTLGGMTDGQNDT